MFTIAAQREFLKFGMPEQLDGGGAFSGRSKYPTSVLAACESRDKHEMV
jgi:hypothetical protein